MGKFARDFRRCLAVYVLMIVVKLTPARDRETLLALFPVFEAMRGDKG